MPYPDHALRSWLFAPGDDGRKMSKALAGTADAVILDLEDSVAPRDKAAARAHVRAALETPSALARYVRVNALDTGLMAEDIAAVASGQPDGFVLPKASGPQDIARCADLAAAHAAPARIVAIATETVSAVRALMREDWSHEALVAMAWGAEDLQADLGAARNKDARGAYLPPFAMAADLALFAAKDAGVAAIDTVYTDFRDPAGLEAEARLACACGFDGKMAIHPAQIEVIHAAFIPTEDELAWARRVIDAMQGGPGVVQIDGAMVDQPHLRAARAIMKRAAGDARRTGPARPE